MHTQVIRSMPVNWAIKFSNFIDIKRKIFRNCYHRPQVAVVPPSVIRGMCLKSGVVSCRELDILDDTSKYIAGATISNLFMDLLRNCPAPASVHFDYLHYLQKEILIVSSVKMWWDLKLCENVQDIAKSLIIFVFYPEILFH